LAEHGRLALDRGCDALAQLLRQRHFAPPVDLYATISRTVRLSFVIKLPSSSKAMVREGAQRIPASRLAPPFASFLRLGSTQGESDQEQHPWGMKERTPGMEAQSECKLRLSSSGPLEGDDPEAGERGTRDEERVLDPMARQLASLWGPAGAPPPVDPAAGTSERLELARAQTLQAVFPALVRKAAWQIAGDRRSATLHLEIGGGAFDGATVLIRADPHEVRIELDAPPGIDLEAWKSRLRLRLASQGLVTSIS